VVCVKEDYFLIISFSLAFFSQNIPKSKQEQNKEQKKDGSHSRKKRFEEGFMYIYNGSTVNTKLAFVLSTWLHYSHHLSRQGVFWWISSVWSKTGFFKNLPAGVVCGKTNMRSYKLV